MWKPFERPWKKLERSVDKTFKGLFNSRTFKRPSQALSKILQGSLKGLPGWTGFFMTQMEIDDLTHQIIFTLQMRCSILPRLANFLATVNSKSSSNGNRTSSSISSNIIRNSNSLFPRSLEVFSAFSLRGAFIAYDNLQRRSPSQSVVLDSQWLMPVTL